MQGKGKLQEFGNCLGKVVQENKQENWQSLLTLLISPGYLYYFIYYALYLFTYDKLQNYAFIFCNLSIYFCHCLRPRT